MPERLSVVVITKNERHNLPACLTSVRFADEVIVVDSFSTDGTAELARAAGARVWQRPWDGYVPQRQFGFDRATGDWILWLDADERVTDELAAEIRSVTAAGAEELYRIPRRHYFLGDWLRHSDQYPGYQMRLVRKGRAQLRDGLYHERIEDEGVTVGTLQGAIDHYSTPTLRTRLKKIGRDARLAALESKRSGTLFAVSTSRLLVNPIRRTGYLYLRCGGYRDGWRGLLWACLSGLEQALIARHVLGQRLVAGRT